MLIRSQNKEVLTNLNALAGIEIAEGPVKTVITSYITGCSYLLGEYSNKQKAVKVLDMLQKAYAEYEMLRGMSTGMGGIMVTYNTTGENLRVFIGGKGTVGCPYYQKKYGCSFEDGELFWLKDVAELLEELKELRAYKEKMELQYLDDIENPLEPLKISAALESMIFTYNYRKENKPEEINVLDYTVMHALKHCLDEKTKEVK